MRMTRLVLENIQAFESASIELDQITVLVGTNNSGKSVFVRSAIALMATESSEHLRRLGTRDSSVSLDADAESIDEVASRFGTGPDELQLRFLVRPSSGIEMAQLGPEGAMLRSAGAPGFAKSLPDAEIVPFTSFRKPIATSEQVGIVPTNLITSKEWSHISGVVDSLSTPGSPFHEAYGKACRAILGFVPYAFPSQGGKKPGKQMRTGEMVFLENMGSGVMHLTMMIALLVQLENKLFLIEEPETELHPDALRHLLELIVDSAEIRRNQFLITTHSHVVVRALGELERTRIYVTETEPGNQFSVPTSKVREIKANPLERREVLESLGYRLDDFDVYDAWLIVEEASIVPILKDWLIPKFAPQLSSRLGIVSAGGVDRAMKRFEDLHGLFLYAHLTPQYEGRAWVLLDGDEKGTKTCEELRDKFKEKWSQEHFRCLGVPSLEDAYPTDFRGEIDQIRETSDPTDKGRKKRELAIEVAGWAMRNPHDPDREALLTQLNVAKDVLAHISSSLSQTSNTPAMRQT